MVYLALRNAFSEVKANNSEQKFYTLEQEGQIELPPLFFISKDCIYNQERQSALSYMGVGGWSEIRMSEIIIF